MPEAGLFNKLHQFEIVYFYSSSLYPQIENLHNILRIYCGDVIINSITPQVNFNLSDIPVEVNTLT